MISATSAVFLDPYLVKLGSLDLMYSAYPRVLPPKKEPVPGRVIWYARQGPMRIHTGPRLTKAGKKAAKKDRIYRKFLPEIFERMRTTVKN